MALGKTCSECGVKPATEYCAICHGCRGRRRRLHSKHPAFSAEEPTDLEIDIEVNEPPQGPRILTLDIETAPLESYTWGIWEQNVGLEQIKTEWSILSYSAKWLDSPDVIFACTGGRGTSLVRDDTVLMEGLWRLLNDADLVVAQNGQRFDIKKINSRLVIHGFCPYSPVRVVDTMLVAKKYFSFTSNKLGWMSRYLTQTQKSEHKKFPGFELWVECLKDNPAAWAEMRHYNSIDVISTEQLYLKQLPWISNHPNLSAYAEAEVRMCPKCNSEDIEQTGMSTKQAGRYARFCCKQCGGWSRSKRQMMGRDKRTSTLVSE